MEDWVQIVDEESFYLLCFPKVGSSKATGKGDSIKLYANGISSSWETEENFRTLPSKQTMLSCSTERMLSCSLSS